MLRLRGNDIEKAVTILPQKVQPVVQVRRSSCITRVLLGGVSIIVILWFTLMSSVLYRLNTTAQVEHKDDFGYLFKRVTVDLDPINYRDNDLDGVSYQDVSMQYVMQNAWPNPDQLTTVVIFAPEADYDVKAVAQFQETLRSVCLQTVQFGDLWILKKSHNIDEVVRVSIPVEGCQSQAQLVQYTVDSFWTSQLATVRTHFTMVIQQNGIVLPESYLESLMAVSAYFANETLAVFGSFGYILPVTGAKFDLKQPIIPVPHPSKLSIDFKQVDLLSDIWFYKTGNLGPYFINSAGSRSTVQKQPKNKKRSSIGHRFKATSNHVLPAFKLWNLLVNSGIQMPVFVTMPLKTSLQHVSVTRQSWHEVLRDELILDIPNVPVLWNGPSALVVYKYEVVDRVLEVETLKSIAVLISRLRSAGHVVLVRVVYPPFVHKQRRVHCRLVVVSLGIPQSACTSPWLLFQFIGQNLPLKQFVSVLKPQFTIVSYELQLDGIKVEKADWKYFQLFAQLPVVALQSWYVPQVQLDIITFNRPASLTRLLASVSNATYLGDKVQVNFHLEAHADQETIQIAQQFEWLPKSINRRSQKAGLAISVLESWCPISNHHYAVILEDDIEVSKLFYVWLKLNLLKYRYGPAVSSQLYGISLYSPVVDEMKYPESPLSKPESLQFLYQIPCSWGAVYFPEVWKGYIDYLEVREPFTFIKTVQGDKEVSRLKHDVTIPGARSNYWLSSWKKFFIEHVYENGLVMLYPNFEASFSTNHLEGGEHIQNEVVRNQKLSMYEVPLMYDANVEVVMPEPSKAYFECDWTYGDAVYRQGSPLQDLSLQEVDVIPVLDLFGKPSSLQAVQKTAENFVVNL